MVLSTRTPTLTPSPTLTPYPTDIPSATQTPTMSPSPEVNSTAGGEQPSVLFGETGVIMTTTIQTETAVFTDVVTIQTGIIHQMAWSPNDDMIAAATSAGIFTFDTVTNERTNALNVGESVSSILFSPNVGILASGGLKGDIHWQDPTNGWIWAVYEGHSLGITDLALSRQGDLLLSGSDDRSVMLWLTNQVMNPNIYEYLPLHVWETKQRVSSIDIRWDGQIAVAGSFEILFVWDAGNREEIAIIEGLSGWVNDVVFSPDGAFLVIADSSNHIKVWETSTWEQTHDIELVQIHRINALVFDPSSEFLAFGGTDGNLFLWNMVKNTTIFLEKYPHELTSLAFNSNGEKLISSYQNGVWRMWDLSSTSLFE